MRKTKPRQQMQSPDQLHSHLEALHKEITATNCSKDCPDTQEALSQDRSLPPRPDNTGPTRTSWGRLVERAEGHPPASMGSQTRWESTLGVSTSGGQVNAGDPQSQEGLSDQRQAHEDKCLMLRLSTYTGASFIFNLYWKLSIDTDLNFN